MCIVIRDSLARVCARLTYGYEWIRLCQAPCLLPCRLNLGRLVGVLVILSICDAGALTVAHVAL